MRSSMGVARVKRLSYNGKAEVVAQLKDSQMKHSAYLCLCAIACVVALSTPVMGQTTFVYDTFTGTAGTALTSHQCNTPSGSVTWTQIAANGASAALASNNEASALGTNGSSTGGILFANSTSPGSANYVVETTWAIDSTSQGADTELRVDARMASSSADGSRYVLRYLPWANGTSGLGTIGLWDKVGSTGTLTQLAGSSTVSVANGSTSHVIALQVYNSTITAFFDGVSEISVSNSDITAAGYAGLHFEVDAGKTVNTTDFLASTLSTTAVTLTSFTVTQSEGGNELEFKTGREVSSLGFNLFREQNGERAKLNSSLLAGTALLAGPKTLFTAGQTHTWWDVPPAGAGNVAYYVEEVDVHGQRTMYGPAIPEGAAPGRNSRLTRLKAGPMGETRMLSQVGRVGAPSSGVNSTSHALKASVTPVTMQASMTPNSLTATPAIKTSTASATGSTSKEYALAAGQAVKIGIQSEGWYAVSQAQLVAAGYNPNASVSTLQLWAEGVQQPLYINGASGGKLSATGDVEFYATGINTTWSLTRIYWLTWGSGSGLSVNTEKKVTKGAAAPASFPFTIEWMPRTVYFAALLNGDGDNFFGPVLDSGDPDTQPLTVTNYNANSTEEPSLLVALQGGSTGPHSVAVELNGYPAGTVTWNDLNEGTGTFAIPNATLITGQNILTLTVTGGDEDVSVVDNVLLTYPHTYTADNDYLKCTLQGGDLATIGGFANGYISVLDVTNPLAVTAVPGTVKMSASGYAISIVPQGAGTRTLLALSSDQVGMPVSVVANRPSSWYKAQAGYDMVMIANSDFIPSLAPLVTWRQGQGHKVAVINVQQLYDEFNWGEKTPYALKNFLSTANSAWKTKPQFVLLAGDATFDPKNYLEQGNDDFVPTYLVDTQLLETASDDWFADFSNTGLPQMAIGRLPIRTAAECTTLVNKIIAYDQAGSSSWTKDALLVADNNDSSDDFVADVQAVQALLPSSLTTTTILADTDSNADGDILSAINSGQGLVDYEGHGSEQIWGDVLFDNNGALGLTNGSMTPVVISMTCLNGYFQDPYEDSLAKALIKAPGSGAVAVWASSGLTNVGPQATMDQALIKLLYSGQSLTLGQAAAAAKAAVTDMDVRRTWVLFGDPASKLKW